MSAGKKAKLESVCKKVSKTKPEELGRPTFSYIDIGSIDSVGHRIVTPQVLAIGHAPSRARQLVAYGDTVFSTVRPYLLNIAWVGHELDGEIASTGFCVLRSDTSKLLPRFLHLFCLSDLLLDQVLPQQRGVSYPAIRDSDVFSAIVPLPTLTEQRRIVEILDEQFSRLDAALASIRMVREKAAAFRRSILQAAFDGELSEDGTAAWEVRKFSEVAHVDSNLTDTESHGDLPHIAPNHIESGTGRLLEYKTVKEDGVTSAKHLFRPGHILYSKIRPYLNKVTLVDFGGLCSADMYPISTSQNAKWLFYVMLSPEFVRLASGTQNRTVLPKTNVRDLSAISFPVPPIPIQERIVEVLEEVLSRLNAALLVTNQLEARIASERRSLLHAAFTGALSAQWREAQDD